MEDEKKPRSRSKAKAEEAQTSPSEGNLSAREAAEVFGATDSPEASVDALPETVAAENPATAEHHDFAAGQGTDPAALPDADQPRDLTPDRDLTLEEPLAKAAEEERVVPPARPVPTEPAAQGGSFWPTLAGGAIAAALGFGAAYFLLPLHTTDPALESRIAEQAQQISAMRSEISALPAPADLSGMEAELSRLSNAATEGESTLDALTSRITALENRPVASAPSGEAGAPFADVSAALESLRSDLSAQAERNAALSGEVESLRSSSAAGARVAEGEAIVASIRMAIELGSGFAPAVERLEQLDVNVPAALKEASGGVAPLSDLRRDFPDAARAALDASYRATGEESFGDRAEMFLRNQLGIRSLTPQEGNSPDAVLSRANAAVQAGQIDQALTEIATLPAAGQAAMAGWISAAKTRVSAQQAADEIVASLTRN
ncbi:MULTISPECIES: COG4223 family protein [unclassified Haematobacter]|uniref:COG4223 family protein n=1 Tax=unclassified Haematobacter TaxID=2640585 RepID=UPI0025B88928|nr:MULTISPECIES: hypothetical protein [unclassified Haematobacter]